jgi:hypothetical protein
MKKYQKIARNLYLLNLALLATHEIDSAFWHEWELFNLPGGIDLFLIINLVLLSIFLIGFEKVLTWEKGATIFSLLLAFSGMFAFAIHSYFILAGNPEFNTTISLAILIFSFIISIGQIVVLIIINRKRPPNKAM